MLGAVVAVEIIQAVQEGMVAVAIQELLHQAELLILAVVAVVVITIAPLVLMVVQELSLFLTQVHSVAQVAQLHHQVDLQSIHSHLQALITLN
jgi:hypothetical protein